MKCLILAAGYATRLYPLTENFPKPLLDINGKTILDYLVDDIESTKKVTEYVVISNHRYVSHFEKWAGERGEKITVIDDGSTENDNRIGAVKDISFAINTMNINDDVLIIAGDNVLDFSLKKFIDYAEEKASISIMRYEEKEYNRLIKCGVCVTRENDRVEKMVEKSMNPPSNWCCPPFYYIPKRDIPLIDSAINDGCNVDAPGSLISWITTHTAVYAYKMDGKRYDIGSLASYEQVKKEYKGIINA